MKMTNICLWGLLLGAPLCDAHAIDVALLKVSAEKQNTVALELELNPSSLPGTISNLNNKEKLLLDTLGTFQVSRDKLPCHLQDSSQSVELVDAQSLKISASLICSGKGNFNFEFPFLSKFSPTFRLIVQFKNAGKEQVAGANAQKTQVSFAANEESSSIFTFIHMGIAHIGALPSEWHDSKGAKLPEGIDHILFVLALLLAGAAIGDLLKVLTGFTIGHSLTLALGTLNLLHLPSQVVESAIAFSIAFVAAESIIVKSGANRWKIALLFGLVHGMGFSSALSQLNLHGMELLKALIGFNVGVECGQIIIAALALPILLKVSNKAFYVRLAKPALASTIFLIGGFWFIQRAFGG
jgi:hypothetical protein